jgi:hypothetical protein
MLSVTQAYLAARAECTKPGPRLAALTANLREQFLPAAFGARVLDHWGDLTDDQRAAFAERAERVLLRPLRDELTQILCDRRDEFDYAEENCDDARCTGSVSVRHRVGDERIQVILYFERRKTGWGLKTTETPGFDVPEPVSNSPLEIGGDRYNIDRHWRHRLGRGRYDAAMQALDQIGHSNSAIP